MKKEEAEQFKKLIDSFIDSFVEIGEGEAVLPVPSDDENPKEKVEFSEADLKKLFRNLVPEGFDLEKAEAIRSPKTLDRVFLKFDNEKRWIPDPETLEKLGFTLADVKEIPDEEMKNIKEGFGLFSVKLW